MTQLKFIVSLACVVAIAACGSPKWTLWEVHDRRPGTATAKEVERELDRAACEAVKDGKIRDMLAVLAALGAERSLDGLIYVDRKPGPDGTFGTTRITWVCLKAGEKPDVRT